MPIYKKESSGKFVPFEKTPFVDLEKVLEDWIESNPHLLLEGEDLVVIGRQPRTAFGKYLDLLAIDETGATVVVELKRGETPRDVVAQALEYASWVDGLSVEHLDEMARTYSRGRGGIERGLEQLYREAFEDDDDEEADDEDPDSGRIAFNHRQRIVVVAERIVHEVEQTLRYLRARMGADVYGIEFSVHTAGGETLVSTTTVVGREPTAAPRSPRPAEQESNEDTLSRVKNDFLRAGLDRLDSWPIRQPALMIRRSARGSGRNILVGGSRWLHYFFAANWIYALLSRVQAHELDKLRDGLSQPSSMIARKKGKGVRFHVENERDLDLLVEIVEERLKHRETPSE